MLGGALVLLLPGFFVDGFHDPFASSKILLALGLGVPAAALLMPRPGRDDPLSAWRRLLAFAPALAIASTLKGPGFAFPIIMASVGWILLEIGAAHGADDARTRRLVSLLGASTIPVLLLGLLRRHAGWFEFIPDRLDVSLSSTIGNSLELAEFAAPVAILSLLLPASGRPWGWALVASSTALVALSESRAGALALVAGLVVTGLLLARRPERAPRTTGQVALGVAIGAVALALLVAPDRARSVLDTEHPTNAVRIGLWQAAVDLWQDEPLFGCGAGRFEASISPFRDPAEWQISGFGVIVEEPHQEVLWMLAEGGLLGLAVIVGALWIVCRTSKQVASSAAPGRRHLAAVSVGGLAAFTIMACVRAPLHHPAGVLPAAVTIGLLAGAAPGRPMRAPLRWLCMALLLAGTFAAWRHLVADRHVHVARWAKVRANDKLKDTDLRGMVEELLTCKNALDSLAEHGPHTATQAWRAALVGRELVTLRQLMSTEPMRAALTARGVAGPETWLPSRERVSGFLDATILRNPHHPLANLERARTALEDGDVGQARGLLEDQRTFRSLPWPSVLELKGHVALRLGTDPATVGAWLEEPGDPTTVEFDDRTAAAQAFSDGDDALALRHALRQLGRWRWDEHTLRLIADTTYRSFGPDSEERKLGDHAVARSRLLFAPEAQRAGNARMAATHIRIALRKDPNLLDAVVLAARFARDSGDDQALEGHLKTLADAGIPESRIERLLR